MTYPILASKVIFLGFFLAVDYEKGKERIWNLQKMTPLLLSGKKK